MYEKGDLRRTVFVVATKIISITTKKTSTKVETSPTLSNRNQRPTNQLLCKSPTKECDLIMYRVRQSTTRHHQVRSLCLVFV